MPIQDDITKRLGARSDAAMKENLQGGYDARTLRQSKYDVSVYQYPSDLGSQDLLHYIEFGINVRGKSEVDKSKRLFEVKRNPDSANMSEQELGTTALLGGTAAGAAIGYGITSTILGIIDKTGSRPAPPGSPPGTPPQSRFTPSAQAGLKAGGAVAGAAAAGATIAFNKLLKPDTSYRISDVIALYVDGPPTVRYAMNYANKDLGTLAGLIKGSAVDNLSLMDKSSESLAAAVTAFAKLPGAFGILDVQTALSASSKTSLNPFREVIFESVDFRSFAFRYKFMPKSKEESEKVRNIIKLFKYHMHPEMSANKLFFIYPSEFQITYYFQSAANSYFHKFAPCVLESMDIQYGGEQFSSFDDGNPTEVNMTLTFRETEILTKKMIDQGY